MIWFTTDTHFGHTNLVLGTSTWEDLDRCRNFGTIEAHDSRLLDGINSVVRTRDTLYHLGDFSIASKKAIVDYRNKIKCKNVHLIYGNHDECIRANKSLQELFISCSDIKRLKFNHQLMILCHYAMRIWEKSHYGSWMLCGHSHGSLDLANAGQILDLAPESHEYRPYSFDEISSIMETKNIQKIDHH